MAAEMIYRRLGNSGLKVSVFSYGSWVTFGRQVDMYAARELIKEAYEAGVNFFDNAEVYAYGESEKIMGDALQQLGFDRDTYILSSKVFFGRVPDPVPTQKGLHRKHIMEACDQALRRLKTDYLDLYFCHRPDPETPVKEIVFAMNDLIRQGKIFYWGTSEWEATRIMHAHLIAEKYNLIGPVPEQPQYNLMVRKRVEKEYDYLYDTVGLGLTTWSPLASGYLTGKYLDEKYRDGRLNLPQYDWLRERFFGEGADQKMQAVRKFVNLAEELGTTPARLAIAWVASNPRVSTVILGASRPEQLKENLQALEDLEKMTPALREKIALIFEPVSDVNC